MDLDELIKNINIVEYISQYVDLVKKGEEWWGLSCFKEEKTPSFSVREDPPLFYDYSSGEGGNLYSFVKKYNHCSGREAVDILKQYAGCTEDIKTRPEKLSATLVCKDYTKRKVLVCSHNTTTISQNQMDIYENRPDKLRVWENEGISKESLQRFGVRYDAISDRIVYPIRNLDGKIVNIGGRILDPEWKEKGLRKYTYFFGWGGQMNIIYGLYDNMDYIKKEGRVILFEGCKSVLLADTFGVKNTGAILTSHLSPAQMLTLATLGCRVIFALDKDVNVLKDKNIQKLKRYVDVEYIFDSEGLLGEKDSPVDKGKDVFKFLYDQRIHIS